MSRKTILVICIAVIVGLALFDHPARAANNFLTGWWIDVTQPQILSSIRCPRQHLGKCHFRWLVLHTAKCDKNFPGRSAKKQHQGYIGNDNRLDHDTTIHIYNHSIQRSSGALWVVYR